MTLHLRPLTRENLVWALDLVRDANRFAAKPEVVREAVWHNLLAARRAGSLTARPMPHANGGDAA